MFKEKYLKYKQKYFNLKNKLNNQVGGTEFEWGDIVKIKGDNSEYVIMGINIDDNGIKKYILYNNNKLNFIKRIVDDETLLVLVRKLAEQKKIIEDKRIEKEKIEKEKIEKEKIEIERIEKEKIERIKKERIKIFNIRQKINNEGRQIITANDIIINNYIAYNTEIYIIKDFTDSSRYFNKSESSITYILYNPLTEKIISVSLDDIKDCFTINI